MTTGISIGLSIGSLAPASWTVALPRVGGQAPFFHFDAARQLFALNEGSGLRALTAAQLATKITSTSDAHAIEDGIGQGVGHNVLIAANGLPLTRAGLQAHSTRTRPHGDFPVNGTDLSATSTAAAAEGIFSPYVIASGGAATDVRRSTMFSTASGTAQSFKALLRAGTSGAGRLALRNAAAGTETVISGALGAMSVTSTAFGAISGLAQAQDSNGDWLIRGVFTPNATVTGNACVAIGPNSATVGQTIRCLGAAMNDGLYPYTDWIMGGSGAVTLNASRNTLPFGGGAVAFAAEIDVRGFITNNTDRFLALTDGTSSNRVVLSAASSVISLTPVNAGTVGTSAMGGSITTGVTRVYGVVAAGYYRVGTVGGADGAAVTSNGMPVIDRIALDGVGYDTSTARAFKYLKRFAQWSIAMGSDTVFGEVKAVAQGWT